MTIRYVVVNEHTLGFQNDVDICGWVSVLGGKIKLGGRSNSPLEEPFLLSSADRVREATAADFEYFRVVSKGHLHN